MRTARTTGKKRGFAFSVLTLLVLVTMLSGLMPSGPAALANPGSGYDSLINAAVEFNRRAYAGGTDLGAYDAYALTLAREDVSGWVYNDTSLKDSVINQVYATLRNPSSVSAKEIAYQLLAVHQWGRTDLAQSLAGVLQQRQKTTDPAAGSFDNNVYSDMPAFEALGRAGYLNTIDTAAARRYILNTQRTAEGSDRGSWGATSGDTYYPDFMTTAQAIRALAYLPGAATDTEIREAIEAGLAWMQQWQRDDGSFVSSWWDDPLIDTAETIHTLVLLEIDPAAWTSGAGKSPVDYMLKKARNEDGSFGTTKNVMDATWALHTYLLLAERFPLPPASPALVVAPAAATITAGNTVQYQAVVRYVYGTSLNVTNEATWSVTDTTVASITATGLVTGLQAGQTVVTATYAGMTAQATLTVTSPSDSGSPGGGSAPRTCTAGIAVVGKSGERLFGPDYVQVSAEGRWGLTALGALDATGLDYKMSNRWEGFVEEIAGQANEGMSGWMYKVNDTLPVVAAKDYVIKAGDRVIWWYSTDMSSSGPTWEDLQQGGKFEEKKAPTPPPGAAIPISDAEVGKALERAAETGVVTLEAPEGGSEIALTVAQLVTIAATEKPVRLHVSDLQFTFPPAVVKELAALDTVQIQLAGRKVGAQAGELLTNAATQGLQAAGDIFDLALVAVAPDGSRKTVDKFAAAITVALPVPEDRREAATTGRLDAYRYNEAARTWGALGGTYDASAAAIMFQTDHLSKYALFEKALTPQPPVPRKTFCDIQGHWAQKDIEIMAGLNIARGMEAGKFYPDRPVTRAEFATLLTRSLEIEEAKPHQGHFQDVLAGAWYFGAIEGAYTKGLVFGYGDGTFRPGMEITRQELATMVARGLTKGGRQIQVRDGEVLLTRFADHTQISPWAREAVAAAVQAGIVAGREENRLTPGEHATRAEAVAMLRRMLVRLGRIPE